MASITGTFMVTGSKPAYSDADLIALFTWLKNIQSQATGMQCTLSCEWTDEGRLNGKVSIVHTKDVGYTEADLAAVRAWVQNKIVATLPSFCSVTKSFVWFP